MLLKQFSKKRHQQTRLDWFEYFEFITIDGVLKRINAKDNDDCDWLHFNGNIGRNVNLFYDYSIDEKQGLNGNIVTLQFSKKWSDISSMRHALEDFLVIISTNILFCEVIAYDTTGEYHRVMFDITKESF